MALIHSLTRLLVHSVLSDLFIKPRLNSFPLPSPLSTGRGIYVDGRHVSVTTAGPARSKSECENVFELRLITFFLASREFTRFFFSLSLLVESKLSLRS